MTFKLKNTRDILRFDWGTWHERASSIIFKFLNPSSLLKAIRKENCLLISIEINYQAIQILSNTFETINIILLLFLKRFCIIIAVARCQNYVIRVYCVLAMSFNCWFIKILNCLWIFVLFYLFFIGYKIARRIKSI